MSTATKNGHRQARPLVITGELHEQLEQALLGSIAWGHDLNDDLEYRRWMNYAVGLLEPADFVTPQHRGFWAACVSLMQASEPVNALTLHTRASELGYGDDVLYVYLSDAVEHWWHQRHIVDYARMVKRNSLHRQHGPLCLSASVV